ncbi:hypothetical protein [Pseudomonas sp. R1-15]|uniref:hypothetical protein n=1 Tax=Pseudomonas sp. R1-15 TaxID=2817399 RepID=UPI003DA8ED77
MIINIDFDVLNTFDCTYGEFEEEAGKVKVFVKGGLALPYGKLTSVGNKIYFGKCAKENSENVERLFPRYYIYDPSRNAEYVEWGLCDGGLKARTGTGEWTYYEGESSGLYAMHEYVGGCWFVFDEVVFYRRTVDTYTPDRQGSSGERSVQLSGESYFANQLTKDFILEGVLDVFPGPGWMSWMVRAKTFYIEIRQ